MEWKRAKKKKFMMEIERDHEEMFRRFRIKTVIEGTTMRDVVMRCIRHYVEGVGHETVNK